jgi:hypothetical protein
MGSGPQVQRGLETMKRQVKRATKRGKRTVRDDATSDETIAGSGVVEPQEVEADERVALHGTAR